MPTTRRLRYGIVVGVSCITIMLNPGSHAQVIIAPDPDHVVAASSITARLARGESVTEERARVTGDLDLEELGTVPASFRCRGCLFEGPIRATDVTFARILDLSGSTIEGAAQFGGALFNDFALFANFATGLPTRFEGPARFSLARFREPVAFDEANFEDAALFVGTLFLSDASFASADFADRALFGSARFSGSTSFTGSLIPEELRESESGCGPYFGAFRSVARFPGATFGARTDFRGRCFQAEGDFTSAAFGGDADLSQTFFQSDGMFERSSFTGEARFVGTRFGKELKAVDLRAESLTMTSAALGRTDLSGAVVTGHMDLDTKSASSLDLSDVHAGSLSIPVELVPVFTTDTNLRLTLAAMAASAEESGELPLAMEILYRREQAVTASESGVWEIARGFLYGFVMGYLVRPLSPLLWLIGALVLGVLLRLWLRRRDELGPGARVPLALQGAFANLARVKPHVGSALDRGDFPRFVEWLAYKGLLACVLIGLAKSNPVLKELIDAFGI